MSFTTLESILRPEVYLPLSVGVASYVFILFFKNIILGRLRKIAEKTSFKIDDIAVDSLYKTKHFFIFGVAAYFGFHSVPRPNPFERYLDGLFLIMLMVQIWFWGNEIINRWIYYTISKKDKNSSVKTTLNFVRILLNLSLISVLVLTTLANFGHDVSTIVAGLGIGGVAIALATKNLLEDLFSSLSIVLDKPFLVGDFISFGEWEGVVEYIGLKTTQIRSVNGELILIANSQMLASKIRNYKRLQERRVSFKFGVSRKSSEGMDLPLVLQKTINSFPNVAFERCNLISFTLDMLSFEIVYWIKTSKYKTYTHVHHEVLQKLLLEFSKDNIAITAHERA